MKYGCLLLQYLLQSWVRKLLAAIDVEVDVQGSGLGNNKSHFALEHACEGRATEAF
jgi:hypothetical protein